MVETVFGQGGNTRMFKNIFSLAQKRLQSVFGMELVELMTRAERDRDLDTVDDGDNSTAVGLKKKGMFWS